MKNEEIKKNKNMKKNKEKNNIAGIEISKDTLNSYTIDGKGVLNLNQNLYSALSTGGIFSTKIYDEFKSPSSISISALQPEPVDEALMKLNEKIFDQTTQINNLTKDLKETRESKKEMGQQLKELQIKLEKLNENTKLRDLSNRICKQASSKLLNDDDFRKMFSDSKSYNTVVISIDIRRSTELMLKTKEPESFSEFISNLCIKLREIIMSNYGIFDKFTGDGVLAFFPQFFTGESAIGYALKSAVECHKYFNNYYKESRGLFSVVLSGIGLGIGIDYDKAYFVDINNVLTMVGSPVVYACRLSNASLNVGSTLLNQQAYNKAIQKYKDYLQLTDTEIDIKNEGKVIVYKLEKISIKPNELIPPAWTKE